MLFYSIIVFPNYFRFPSLGRKWRSLPLVVKAVKESQALLDEPLSREELPTTDAPLLGNLSVLCQAHVTDMRRIQWLYLFPYLFSGGPDRNRR